MSNASSKTNIAPPWRPWQATLAAILVLVGAQLLIGLVLGAIGANLSDFTISQNLALSLVASLLSIGLAWWFASWFGAQPKKYLGLVKPSRTIWGLLGVSLLIFILASSLLTTLIDTVWPQFEADQAQDIGLDGLSGAGEYIGAFVLLVVITPLTEEIVFRGILFAGWRRHGFVVAAVVSSLLFGLAHWQPNVVLATFVLGWLLAWLYEKTGSLWAPIGLHALKNGLAFALVYGLKL